MSDYSFRGQPISGPHAYVLLGSIKRVQEEASNPTAEEIKALEEIVADFSNKWQEALREDYRDENLFLPDGKIYACPKCDEPMYKQKSHAIWWCSKCDHVYDAWYDEEPVQLIFQSKET